MSLDRAKEASQMRQEGDPGLSGWAINVITGVLKGRRQRQTGHKRGEGSDCGGELAVTQPQAKRCPQPPEVERGRELGPPLDHSRGCDLAL